MVDLNEFHDEDQVAHLRAEAKRLQSQLVRAKNRNGEIISVIEAAALEAAIVVGRPKVVKPVKDRRKKTGEVALLHATDWQVGKSTMSYSSEIAQERIKTYIKKVLKITEIMRADHPVRKAVLLLGGDMVEGVGIFPGQAFEVDSTVYEQIFVVTAMIDGMVRSLSENFEEVEIWTEYGNHGRLGRKGDHPAQDNIDLMAYRIAEETTKDVANVTWHISTDWHQIVQIGSYRALLVHGDEIKSFGGNTPAFGISRKVNAWASGVVEPFVDCYMGHFHQPLTVPIARGGRVFVSPSMESGSEYAREFVAAKGEPGQRLNFIDSERGRVTSEWMIWLDSNDER